MAAMVAMAAMAPRVVAMAATAVMAAQAAWPAMVVRVARGGMLDSAVRVAQQATAVPAATVVKEALALLRF